MRLEALGICGYTPHVEDMSRVAIRDHLRTSLRRCSGRPSVNATHIDCTLPMRRDQPVSSQAENIGLPAGPSRLYQTVGDRARHER